MPLPKMIRRLCLIIALLFPKILFGQETILELFAVPENLSHNKVEINNSYQIAVHIDSLDIFRCLKLRLDTIKYKSKVSENRYKAESIKETKSASHIYLNYVDYNLIDSLEIESFEFYNQGGFVQTIKISGNCIDSSTYEIINGLLSSETNNTKYLSFDEIIVRDLRNDTKYKLSLTIQLIE